MINKLLSWAQNIVVITHISPDLDGVCSMLGMYSYIRAICPGKKVRMAISGKPCYQGLKLKNVDKIEFVPEVLELASKANLAIFLDGNTFDRFSHNPGQFKKLSAKTICIDHHQGKPDKFDYTLIDTNAGATCKIVADMMLKLRAKSKAETKTKKGTAETLLLGMLADTGIFSLVDSENVGLFSTVRKLVSAGKIGIREVVRKHMALSSASHDVFRQFAVNMKKTRIDGYPDIIYSYVDRGFSRKYDIDAIAEGYRQFLFCFVRNVEGFPWGFVVFPNEHVYKLQLRSSPEGPDVGLIAERHFQGGGHKYAAGGQIEINESAVKACEKVFSLLKKVV